MCEIQIYFTFKHLHIFSNKKNQCRALSQQTEKSLYNLVYK